MTHCYTTDLISGLQDDMKDVYYYLNLECYWQLGFLFYKMHSTLRTFPNIEAQNTCIALQNAANLCNFLC